MTSSLSSASKLATALANADVQASVYVVAPPVAVYLYVGTPPFKCTTPGATCNALADFYNATRGSYFWRYTNGWPTAASGTPSDYCSGWTGVTCANGIVTKMCVHSRVGSDACGLTRDEAHPPRVASVQS